MRPLYNTLKILHCIPVVARIDNARMTNRGLGLAQK